MTRVFWNLFGVVFAAVVGGLWWLIGYMAEFPRWGSGLLGGFAFVAVGAFMHLLLAKRERDDADDDGSGERPVWSAADVQDRLSAFASWTNGDSFLRHSDDTQEMPAPGSDDRTRVYNSGLFDLRVNRPEGKHRAKAGVR